MIQVSVHYRLGHTYVRQMIRAEMFCPACAKRTVWVEDSAGDYYQGPTHVCVSCGSEFCIQGPTPPYTGSAPSDDVAGQIVRAIRSELKANRNG